MLSTVVIFLVILGVLVFVHELGHFLAARKLGIAVEEFGFGFPPRIFGIKRGSTIYSINWLPLGGFVKIKGEQGDQAEAPDSFASRKPWQRIWVLSAGVIFNIILAMVLYSAGYMFGLPQSLSDQEAQQLGVTQAPVIISEILPDGAADKAGIMLGDTVVELDHQKVDTLESVYTYLGAHRQTPVIFNLQRQGKTQELTIEAQSIPSGEKQFGLGFVRLTTVRYSFFEAIGRGVMMTINVLLAIIIALATLLYKIVTFQGGAGDVSGPVGVAVLTADVARLGWIHLVNFMAVLSINLAVINILPFPALDGGRILFVLIEKLRGRPVSETIERRVHTTGFIILLALMALVTFKDIAHYGGGIWQGLMSYFS